MVEHGHEARMEFNWEPRTLGEQSKTKHSNRELARKLAHEIEDIIAFAKRNIQKAQAR